MIDQDLQNAYEKAVYSISKPPISWKVGNKSPELDELLRSYDVTVATFITAYNPKSMQLAKKENQVRNAELANVLNQAGYTYINGQGEDPEGVWLAEASYLVLGMGIKEALPLGRRFVQNAVLIIAMGKPVRLLLCSN